MFKNIKQAQEHYDYPMSHRMGSIYDEKGVIRSYSNGTKGDYETKKYFYYKLKNHKIKDKFKLNIVFNKKLRLFVKLEEGVLDKGLYNVKGFFNGFVRLEK